MPAIRRSADPYVVLVDQTTLKPLDCDGTSTRKSPEMHVHFLTPDIAILYTRFWIDGEVLHDDLSQASRESIGTRVVRKIDGRWRIVATQNTDVRSGRRH